jgi:hypothetical protein
MHRVHDYAFLIQRWRAVARATGLRLEEFARADQARLFCLRSKALTSDGGIYISAGIHGDEPAGPEALITWAEENHRRLGTLPLFLFPCLNPWGLVNNCRFDATGVDLNRVFHLQTVPVITALKHVIAPYRFALALMLHEDFDGQGVYLYELQRAKPFWGEALLQAAGSIIPIEGRSRIEGRKANAGLIRRRLDKKRFARMGYPEAIWLHSHHALRTLTLETPSEFAVEQRVAALIAIIDEGVRRVAALTPNKRPSGASLMAP